MSQNMRFSYALDDEAQDFIKGISDLMQALFGVSREEAEGRIEAAWGNLKIGGPDELAYHEDEEFWANNFYYGHNSSWWIVGELREELGLPELIPTPWPPTPNSE